MLQNSLYCFPKDWSACPQCLNRNTIWNSLLFSIGCHNYFSNWNLIILGTIYFWIIWVLSSLVILTFQFVFYPFCQCLFSFRYEHCRVVLVYGSFSLTWYGLFGRSGMWEKMIGFSLLSLITVLMILYETDGFLQQRNWPAFQEGRGKYVQELWEISLTSWLISSTSLSFCYYVTAGFTHTITSGKNLVIVAVHVT